MMEIEWGIDTGKIAWLLDILSLNIEQSDAVAGVIQQNCLEDNSLWVYVAFLCFIPDDWLELKTLFWSILFSYEMYIPT